MKYLGETNEQFTHGEDYFVTTQFMTGKIYKSLDDLIGVPDNRIAAWGPDYYKVYNNLEELQKDWNANVERVRRKTKAKKV